MFQLRDLAYAASARGFLKRSACARVSRVRRLVPEELLDGLQVGFGHVEVFLSVLGVLLLHEEARFGEIEVHALLCRDDVAAKAIAGSSLLVLQVVERLRNGSRAAFDVGGLLFDLFGKRGILMRNGVRGCDLLTRAAGRRRRILLRLCRRLFRGRRRAAGRCR